jgi:hypothetical protein
VRELVASWEERKSDTGEHQHRNERAGKVRTDLVRPRPGRENRIQRGSEME